MSNKSLIVRCAALALMLTLPVGAFAQTSRVEGMALQGDYIKDYTGIYTYVSGLPSVGNLVYGELGSGAAAPTDRGMGAVLGNLWDGKFGTWAIHMRQQTPSLGQGDATSQPGAKDSTGISVDPNTNHNESFDLMWGKKFGTMNLGLRLNRSYRKYKIVNNIGTTTIFELDNLASQSNPGRNITGFAGGLGFDWGKNTGVELSALFESRTFESTVSNTPATSNKDDGGSTYQLAGRMFWQWSPSVIVTPVIKVYSYDLSRKTGTPQSFDNKLSGWQAGAAGNWNVGTSDLFVLGATFAQNTLDEGENVLGLVLPAGIAPTMKLTESISPQVFAALETHINRWLTLRFGANKGAFQKVKWINQGAAVPQTNEFSMSSFNMNLGAGVKLGTLQLDAVMDNNFAHHVTMIGSTGAPTFGKVTATYAF